MEYTTEQYRQDLKLPYRGESHVWVYVGLVNNKAQRSAHITSSFSGSEKHLYDGSATVAYVTSTENDGHIQFEFEGYENNIAGLTLQFVDAPYSITVTNGNKTKEFVCNYNNDFMFDDGYENSHYIKITPNSGKLKIQSIMFGIGLQFGDAQLVSTERNNVINHISNELPQKRFTFVAVNNLRLFNKDNPYGYSKFFEEKQLITYEYGRELSDGTLYKMRGGKVLLKEWSSDDYQAKFTCCGRIDYLNGDFYKGQYYENGISALQLAQIVLEDAGVTEYVLDPSLSKTKITNPIPVCTHKDALQMIANACRCIFYEDRDGNICLRNANLPSFVGDVTFTGATSYSIPSALFDDNSMFNYADAEYQYTKADGSFMFLPENSEYEQVGFVSSEIANSNGLFTNNPHIDIAFCSEYHITALVMQFSTIFPTSVTVTFYLDDGSVDSQTITSFEMATVVSYDGVIDALRIDFNGASPNQRIHLNNISLQGYLDYELTYRDLKSSPIANSLEMVSKLNVYYRQFSKDDSTSENVDVQAIENESGGDTLDILISNDLDNVVVTIDAVIGDNLAIFSTPHYDLTVDKGVIKEQGAYYIIVTSDIEGEILVRGKEFVVADNVYEIDIHENGVEKNAKNPLVGNLMMAKVQGGWLKDFYDDDLEYSLTYRGDPALDADDLIYLENHFVAMNEIQIEEESLSTSMGTDFTCRILGRRKFYQVSATIGGMIVGKSCVGEVL